MKAVVHRGPGDVVLAEWPVPPVGARQVLARVRPYDVYRREITLRGSFVNPHTHGRALALLAAGRLQVAPLISRRVALDEVPDVLARPARSEVKVMAVME